ncbi:hypothetical protein QUF80_21945, partial [Desulfococcaceae bacterium HSG8]|nr:hypothetical protein [Desulfococcaceae bacterium HSG8]
VIPGKIKKRMFFNFNPESTVNKELPESFRSADYETCLKTSHEMQTCEVSESAGSVLKDGSENLAGLCGVQRLYEKQTCEVSKPAGSVLKDVSENLAGLCGLRGFIKCRPARFENPPGLY